MQRRPSPQSVEVALWRRIRPARAGAFPARSLLALAAVIVGCGLFSSSIGSGALPPASVPPFGATNGDGSLSTVAELGDVNGDGVGDYAVGLPSSDAGGSDSGIVYVFLGKHTTLSGTPASLNLASADFTITGHGGEMLGYAIAGADMNGDGRNDIAIGAPMAGAPSKSGGGAVYVIYGSTSPQSLNTSTLSAAGLTNDPVTPNTTWPSTGSRYDGFAVDSHTGMSLAALPDINGDGMAELAVGAPDTNLHITGGGLVAVVYGKPSAVHIALSDIWGNGYPYYFHIDWPPLADHVGVTVASVGDMTGDGLPDLAIGAPHAGYNGRADSGSVWIINGHRPDIGPPECYTMTPPATCHLPWLKLNNLGATEGYRIDGAAAGDELGSSLAGVGDENGDGVWDLAIGAAGASPNGRAGAGEVVVMAGVRNFATRDLATSAPLQTIIGPSAGAGLGASLAAAGGGNILAGAPGQASSAGAVYLVSGSPGSTSDLAGVPSIVSTSAGAMAGSNVAAGSVLDNGGADALIAAPGANTNGAWFVIGGTGTPVLPPPPGTPSPPAPPAPPPPPPPPAPPAPPVKPPGSTTVVTANGTVITTTKTATGTVVTTTTPGGVTTTKTIPNKPVVKKKKKKLPLCPLKKPRPKYHVVKGKRVKVKQKPCRPRPKTKAKAKAKA